MIQQYQSWAYIWRKPWSKRNMHPNVLNNAVYNDLQNQCKYPLTDEWVTMEYYLAIEMNKVFKKRLK